MSTAGQDVTTRKNVGNTRKQSGDNLEASAEGGCGPAQAANGLEPAVTLPARVEAAIGANALRETPWAYTCKVRLKIAVFFDGTGNNLDADASTKEHSNVARLYRSHIDTYEPGGIYRLYVPGIGTYFRDIGDPGKEEDMAFGKGGEPRLQWAMKKLDAAVARHHAINITGLDIALFGFSRGAALARAFAIRLHARCRPEGTGWRWDTGAFKANIYFMGLFDTVASVGLPASSSVGSLRIAKGWAELNKELIARRRSKSNGLEPWDADETILGIAFGAKPGADPTPGIPAGHGDWARELHIPPLVSKCLHFVAGNEVRNSFPLDSARNGKRYPHSVDERVFPGAHSNVGGGYRPGEGGKSTKANELLSAIPLRAMHDAALAAGVPLSHKEASRSDDDFAVSPELLDCFNAFASFANSITRGQSVESRFLVYMRLFYAWRFKRIRQRGANPRPDADIIKSGEARFLAESAQLEKEIAAAEQDPVRLQAKADLLRAEREVKAAESSLSTLERRRQADPRVMAAAQERLNRANAAEAAAKELFSEADDPHMKLVARQATLPGAGLADRMDLYDINLLADVAAVQNVRRAYPSARLRPHYINLIDAYEAEYLRNKGLLDEQPKVLAMFDNYVHDSLAGFAKDQTLPSDPRVIYIGGDEKLLYSVNQNPPLPPEALAA